MAIPSHAEAHRWSEPQLDQSNATEILFFRCCCNCGAIEGAQVGQGWKLMCDPKSIEAFCRPFPPELDAEGRAL